MAARVRKAIQAKQVYSTQEAAEILGVSAMSIYRWVKAGQLTAVKVGASKSTHLRITRASIEALLGEPIAAPIPLEDAPALATTTEPAAQHQQEAGQTDPAPEKETTMADVLEALETLQNTISLAMNVSRYSHFRPRLEALQRSISTEAQELGSIYGSR